MASAAQKLRRLTGVDLGAFGFKFGFKLDTLGEPGGATLAHALGELVDQARTDVVLIVDEVQHAITSEEGNQKSERQSAWLKECAERTRKKPFETPGSGVEQRSHPPPIGLRCSRPQSAKLGRGAEVGKRTCRPIVPRLRAA